jgi:Ca-activated chloride channel family protein
MQPHDPYSDDWIDAQLRAVPVPDQLVDRLRAGLWPSDEELDRRLRAVPLPFGMLHRLKRIVPRTNKFEWLYRAALAAVLLVAVGTSFLFSLLLVGQRPSAPHAGLPELALRGPGETAREMAVGQLDLDRAQNTPRRAVPAAPIEPEIELMPLERRDRPGRADADLPSKWRLEGMVVARDGPDPFLDGNLARWPVLPAHRPFDELPELNKVPGPTPQGMHVPLAPGFDLPFFIRTRVHPFVVPGDPRLQTTAVPLGISTSSYELAKRFVADGELPPPEVVRVEEFLAAMDYGFPRPVGVPVALQLAAGPSPFGGEAVRAAHGGRALQLVQIGVQARDVTRAKREPATLVLAVDSSASMAWGGRLEMVGRALSGLTDELDPDDRLALVTFSEAAQLLAEEIGRDERDRLREALGRLKPAGSTNVGAALREAYAVAGRMTSDQKANRVVVLLTDGLAELDRVSNELIGQRLKEAAAHGIRLEIVDLGQSTEERNLESQLENFARAGKGQVRRAADAQQVTWAMREILTGKSQRVARDVRLKVTFQPGAVLQYRLLGHEAAAVAGLLPAAPEADFFSGQSATALYEVWLRPKGSDEVAQVELSWLEPDGQQRRSAVRKLTRRMFTPTLATAPDSLVAGAVVAEAAEVLRQSPFAAYPPNPGSLSRVAELVGQIDTRIRTRPAFAEFVTMLQRAQKAKAAAGGARR